MAFIKRIDRIFVFEILSLTIVILAALSSVMFMFRILQFSEFFIFSSETFQILLMFIVLLLPTILKITLPVSLFMASTIVVMRMANDRELEAWMAAGVGVPRISLAMFSLGSVMVTVSVGMSLFAEPLARQERRKFQWMHARKSVELVLETRLREKTFASQLFSSGDTDIAFYTDALSESRKEFKGVFISFRNKKNKFASILIAESGSLSKENRNGVSDYVITFRNGHFYQPSETSHDVHSLAQQHPETFSLKELKTLPGDKSEAQGFLPLPPATDWTVTKYSDFKISLVSLFQKQSDTGAFDSDDIRSLYPREYLTALKKARASKKWGNDEGIIRDYTYFYESIVIPLSCFFLPLLGLCLGIQDPRRKAGMAYLGMALVLFTYYASIMICQTLARRFIVSPEVSLWFPPLLLTCISGLLMRWRSAYPPSTGFIEYVKLDLEKVRAKVSNSKAAGRKSS